MVCEINKAIINKPVCLGQSGLALKKSLMDELNYKWIVIVTLSLLTWIIICMISKRFNIEV